MKKTEFGIFRFTLFENNRPGNYHVYYHVRQRLFGPLGVGKQFKMSVSLQSGPMSVDNPSVEKGKGGTLLPELVSHGWIQSGQEFQGSKFFTNKKISKYIESVFKYDFLPEFSAKIRPFIYHPAGVLVLAGLASLLFGFFLHTNGFVLFSAIVFILVAGMLWPWLNLRGLAGTIRFEHDRLTEGETTGIILNLKNFLPWTAWGLAVRGSLCALDKQDQYSPVALAGLRNAPARQNLIFRWNIQPRTRGVYPFRPLLLTTAFPFGLWESKKTLENQGELIVWPRTFPVGPVPPVSVERQVEGSVSHARVGNNGDVLGVRPYRRGDSPRRIHWAQSARHDKLIVCELQSNSRPVIQLVLDIDQSVHRGDEIDGTWAWALRTAASFAKGWLDDGVQVAFAWAGGEVPASSGKIQVRKILDVLARIQPKKDEPIEKILTCPLCRGFRDGLQIIITTDLTKASHGCHGCFTESQRWVILETRGFGGDSSSQTCFRHKEIHHCGAPAWLTLKSPSQVPFALKGEWREARHGS